jgi:hypothetical protein
MGTGSMRRAKYYKRYAAPLKASTSIQRCMLSYGLPYMRPSRTPYLPRKLPVTTRELYNKAVIAQSGKIASINLKVLRCNTSVQPEELASVGSVLGVDLLCLGTSVVPPSSLCPLSPLFQPAKTWRLERLRNPPNQKYFLCVGFPPKHRTGRDPSESQPLYP